MHYWSFSIKLVELDLLNSITWKLQNLGISGYEICN